jgi:hypothetical protein
MLPAGIVIPHLASCDAGGSVPGTPSRLLWSNCLVGLNIGISTRKLVFRGWDSHSMMPPLDYACELGSFWSVPVLELYNCCQVILASGLEI